MGSRFGLLRLDYTFSVIIPMLMAIYLNRLNPFNHIDILIGFLFFAITGNTWNDVIDMRDPNEVETLKRVEGYHPKEIFTIGFCIHEVLLHSCNLYICVSSCHYLVCSILHLQLHLTSLVHS